MLSVQLIGDKELIARLSGMPSKLQAALVRKVSTLALQLEAKVKNDKLSGQVLNVKTGNLRRSIANEVQQSSDSVTGRVFSSGDVKYAAIHEFGGDIKKSVTMAWGKPVKNPKEFTFHYPERSYMRSSLTDMKDQITEGLHQAVMEALTT